MFKQKISHIRTAAVQKLPFLGIYISETSNIVLSMKAGCQSSPSKVRQGKVSSSFLGPPLDKL